MTNMSQHIKPLSFDAWYSLNEESINIELAESGADRELDFNPERIFEDRYDTYVESCDKAFEDELNKWKF